jgi:hypothetical protein
VINPYEAPQADALPARPVVGREVYWAVWAVVAAFGTYFCMYAFRKPFTAAGFEDLTAFGRDLKPVLVASQLGGYMLSKFIGIKVIAEMPHKRRARSILALIAAAEAALILFGIIPPPWNAACLFLNGLALGMVFGLVLGFLEGRQQTEALVAGLCASFILADGVVKSVGAWLLSHGVSEFWMPSMAGLLFLAPLILCTWMLSRIPPPSAHDISARAARPPLNRAERWLLLHRYAPGLVPLLVMYAAVTVLRSLRADFAREIWIALGQPAQPSTFTQSEIYVALGVLAVNGCAVSIRDNRRAFFMALSTCGLGFVMIAAALVGRELSILSSLGFMVTIGLGLYFPYVAIHTTAFERLLAMTRDRGNVGFLMYVADSSGYLGYLAVMGLWGGVTGDSAILPLFTFACWLTVAVALVCLALSWRYFAVRCAGAEPASLAEAAT